MNNTAKRLRFAGLICIGLLVLAGTLGGCTEDDDDQRSNVFTPDDQDDEDAGVDEGDADVDDGKEDVVDDPCDGVDCDDGQVCEDGECLSAGDGFSCATAEVVELHSEGVHTVTHDPAGTDVDHNTTCSNDGEESAESVFRLDFDDPIQLSANITDSEHNLVKDLRRNDCGSPGASIRCSQNDWNEQLDPDDDYYLIVEATNSWMISNFELELEVEDLVCTPAGDWNCEGDELVQCYGGTEERYYDCATGCADGECVGDSCANPIEIEASQSTTVDLSSYNNNISFSNSSSCSTSGTSGSDTSGQEVVFSLRGLDAGTTVEMTPPSTAYVTGVLETCTESSPECIAADSTQGELEWEVPADGDYYVVMNRFSSSGEEGEFSIDILD